MPSDVECAQTLREARWPVGISCVYCGSENVSKRGWRGLYQRYRCNECNGWFNDKTGTPMAYSHLPIKLWFYSACQLQSKVSVKELSKTLHRPYTTVFRMVKKLRENLYMSASSVSLAGIVELDEVYVSAGVKGNMDLKRQPRRRGLKRRGRGSYSVDKPPILGVVQRKGPVRLIPMKDVATRTMLVTLLKNFDLDDLDAFYTDEYPAYNFLKSLCFHETVNHSIEEYARGNVHTNTVEGEFSVYRPWMDTFRGVSKENLHLYTAHYNFLRNDRDKDRTQKSIAMLIPGSAKILT